MVWIRAQAGVGHLFFFFLIEESQYRANVTLKPGEQEDEEFITTASRQQKQPLPGTIPSFRLLTSHTQSRGDKEEHVGTALGIENY